MGSRDLRAGTVLAVLAFAVCGASAPAVAAHADAPPPIFIGGRAVAEPAVLEHGHLLVPVRGVFETLHASVVYTAPRIVVVRKNGVVIAGLLVDRHHAVVRNMPFYLAVPPIRRHGRIYVPLRDIAEIIGATVDYEQHPRLVSIHVPAEQLTDEAIAAPAAPLNAGPPLWAVGGVALVSILLSAECLRRLMLLLARGRRRA
jgi:hypothetical protein